VSAPATNGVAKGHKGIEGKSFQAFQHRWEIRSALMLSSRPKPDAQNWGNRRNRRPTELLGREGRSREHDGGENEEQDQPRRLARCFHHPAIARRERQLHGHCDATTAQQQPKHQQKPTHRLDYATACARHVMWQLCESPVTTMGPRAPSVMDHLRIRQLRWRSRWSCHPAGQGSGAGGRIAFVGGCLGVASTPAGRSGSRMRPGLSRAGRARFVGVAPPSTSTAAQATAT